MTGLLGGLGSATKNLLNTETPSKTAKTATLDTQGESQWDLGFLLGSKTISKSVSKIVRNPTLLKTCFLQPLTHIMKFFSVLKASNFDQNLMKKVMSKRIPRRTTVLRFQGLPQEEKVSKRLPKGIPQGPPEGPRTSQNGFQKRS